MMNHKRPCQTHALSFMLFFILLLIKTTPSLATVPTVTRTKQQLTHLNDKVSALQKSLSSAADQRKQLYQAMALTEKKMGEQIYTLHTVQTETVKKKQAILALEQEAERLRQQLHTQQQTLARHLKFRYQQGSLQPMQWLLNQDNLQAMDRLLTYYPYLIRADQTLIATVRTTAQTLSANQAQLSRELATAQKLQQTLVQQQKKLKDAKQQHALIIQSLNRSIQTKQQALTNYQQDRARLQTLMESFSKALPTHSTTSPVRFNAKFFHPLNHAVIRSQARNQGILFVAHEATPVSAVLPGKVVFSDWLNGYGLMIIIDHGQGMMSLYAHNESLFKSKGSYVKQGDQIAKVGHTGGNNENGLYFELRRRGKAIPPRQWLS
jgi:septal ring factor EnvC (AmiA/AmiB activator)